jgi:hypothetical protein
MRQAQTAPVDHMARVQGIAGRAIVNFTARGVRNGLLSADQYGSAYNRNMIRVAEARGQRLHDQFASTWQATLGRRIVEAAQYDWMQDGAIQERLGSALVQVAQAQMNFEEGRAVRQEQLASLIFAAARDETAADRTMLPIVQSLPEDGAVASTGPASWPEIPVGYLIAAGVALATVFFGGLSMAAQSRERKALAATNYDARRWVYRMAA